MERAIEKINEEDVDISLWSLTREQAHTQEIPIPWYGYIVYLGGGRRNLAVLEKNGQKTKVKFLPKDQTENEQYRRASQMFKVKAIR